MQDAASEVQLRDEEGDIRSDFLHAVSDALERGDVARARALTIDLHEADLADLIQLLRPDERAALIEALGEDFKAAALPELDEPVRDQVLEEMPAEQVAEALQQLDSDEAVYLLEDLDKDEQKDILAKLPYFERIALQRSLEYPEDSAGRIMQTDLIAVPPFWSVGQTIDYMRVADESSGPVLRDLRGRSGLSSDWLVWRSIGSCGRGGRSTIESITDEDVHPGARSRRTKKRWPGSSSVTISPRRRSSTRTGGLVGVITADDVVEVVQEEASEDILGDGRCWRRVGQRHGLGDDPAPLQLAVRQSDHGHPRLHCDQPVRGHHLSRWWRWQC